MVKREGGERGIGGNTARDKIKMVGRKETHTFIKSPPLGGPRGPSS